MLDMIAGRLSYCRGELSTGTLAAANASWPRALMSLLMRAIRQDDVGRRVLWAYFLEAGCYRPHFSFYACRHF